MSVRIFAPAKINLTLDVGRPREDGLHPLQSVVAFADVGDWVEASKADTLSISVSGPFASELTQDHDNLALRAARELAKAAGVSEGAALKLEKNLPIASGMGGGSSDAAAALKACAQLWRLDWSAEHLLGVARELGADVPVCLGVSAAYMTGAGERFEPITLPELHGVLVNPLKTALTADVYRAFDRMELGDAFAPAPAPRWTTSEAAIEAILATGNDLVAPARALVPEIDAIISALSNHERVRAVSMTGSGGTVFAIVNNSQDAQKLAAEISQNSPNWWIRPARLA